MNVENEIQRLMALAEPFRAMADDDLAKLPLSGIVDEINALRAVQAAPGFVDEVEAVEVVEDEPKRKAGRPAKHHAKGDDA